MTFAEHWKFITDKRGSFVQEYSELEHVYKLMQGCESYLEVGSAEGNSLYILAHALKPGAHITYIDWDEKHTREPRIEVLRLLTAEGYSIRAIHANTMHREAIEKAAERKYDVVLIDAGHTFDEAYSDAMNYGKLATKYIIFHDVCIPDVDRAFGDAVRLYTVMQVQVHRFINSTTYGYGIIEV